MYFFHMRIIRAEDYEIVQKIIKKLLNFDHWTTTGIKLTMCICFTYLKKPLYVITLNIFIYYIICNLCTYLTRFLQPSQAKFALCEQINKLKTSVCLLSQTCATRIGGKDATCIIKK